MTELYLDNNATTHLLPAVQDAITQAMAANLGNPSSPHFAGDKARRVIEQSREKVASLVHAEPSQIVFTSGATEANNAVIQGVMAQSASTGAPHFVACVTEHSSILGPLEAAAQRGAQVTLLPVDHAGGLPLAGLSDVIATRPQLVTIQMANSETGRIHPISQVMDELTAIFADLGFSIAEGPDVESDDYNFTKLNFPEGHPAREMHDTFFFAPNEAGERKLLRTHTSPVQVRTMLAQKPPIRVICPGRTC